MNDGNNDLWKGGPWEQPAPAFPQAPEIPQTPMRPPEPARASGQVLRPARRRRRWPWVLLLLALAAGITAAIWLGSRVSFRVTFRGTPFRDSVWQQEEPSYTAAGAPSIPAAPANPQVTVTLAPPTGEELSNTGIYEKCAPWVVSIEGEDDAGYSTGTGLVLTADGYLVTNAHLLTGCRQVRAVTADNAILDCRLVGYDAREDLAVLKVEAEDLTPAQFGDSNALRVGDRVAALGDPLGYRSTMTEGIVSALDRQVEVEGVTMALIQTSAAINFGNSGGALLNGYGQVVGVTAVKLVADDGSTESMGFAIPSRRVKFVVDALMEGREIRAGVFGFTVSTRAHPEGGLEILGITPGSDAQAKGIQVGDVIVEAGGETVSGIQDLIRVKQSRGAGDAVSVTCRRDGQTFTVDVVLMEEEDAG